MSTIRSPQFAGQLNRALALALCGLTLGPVAYAAGGDEISRSARNLHESVLTLDTHLDTPSWFGVSGWSIFDQHSVKTDGSQVDLPRMKAGGLDGGFWATYVPQGPLTAAGRAAARDAALVRLAEIREFVAAHPSEFEIALTPEDGPRIAAAGKRVVYLSMENGYPFGEDLSLLATFHKLGVRIAGPVHFLNNDLGDSASDPQGRKWHGLSSLGKAWVAEANRLGILIDASHASDDVLDQLIATSRAPIILTHSGVRAMFDHPRNVDDERLKRLAASGGVIQIYAFSDYMISNPRIAARDSAMAGLRRGDARTLAQRTELRRQLTEIDRKYPRARATFDDFMQHLLHAIEVAGIDHVGIGIDFDGGGGVTGLDEASDYPKVTARLLAGGYSKSDIAKVWSGNALRVLGQAQAKPGARETDAAH